jgi:hypothetical protein
VVKVRNPDILPVAQRIIRFMAKRSPAVEVTYPIVNDTNRCFAKVQAGISMGGFKSEVQRVDDDA